MERLFSNGWQLSLPVCGVWSRIAVDISTAVENSLFTQELHDAGLHTACLRSCSLYVFPFRRWEEGRIVRTPPATESNGKWVCHSQWTWSRGQASVGGVGYRTQPMCRGPVLGRARGCAAGPGLRLAPSCGCPPQRTHEFRDNTEDADAVSGGSPARFRPSARTLGPEVYSTQNTCRAPREGSGVGWEGIAHRARRRACFSRFTPAPLRVHRWRLVVCPRGRLAWRLAIDRGRPATVVKYPEEPNPTRPSHHFLAEAPHPVH